MQGSDDMSESLLPRYTLFSYVDLEARISARARACSGFEAGSLVGRLQG